MRSEFESFLVYFTQKYFNMPNLEAATGSLDPDNELELDL